MSRPRSPTSFPVVVRLRLASFWFSFSAAARSCSLQGEQSPAAGERSLVDVDIVNQMDLPDDFIGVGVTGTFDLVDFVVKRRRSVRALATTTPIEATSVP